MRTQQKPAGTPISGLLKQVVFKMAAGMAMLALLLFLPAGTLSWGPGWLYLLFFSAWAFCSVYLLGLRSPELLLRRFTRVAPVAEPWDKIFSVVFTPLIALVVIVSSARSETAAEGFSYVTSFFGFAGVAFAYVLLTLSLLNNDFAVPNVVLQAGQKPAEGGPYSVVRHPMYLASICLFCCTPSALGSFAGLVPAVILTAAVLLRTYKEDCFLLKNLPGYAAYAARVRYRLVPGVW